MVLLRFRNQDHCDQFYRCYNGREYNSLEPGNCQVVYVKNVEFSPSQNGAISDFENLTELPTCPVCLERMDESVEGVLTVLCNHNYHTACLEKCSDTTCPVCR